MLVSDWLQLTSFGWVAVEVGKYKCSLKDWQKHQSTLWLWKYLTVYPIKTYCYDGMCMNIVLQSINQYWLIDIVSQFKKKECSTLDEEKGLQRLKPTAPDSKITAELKSDGVLPAYCNPPNPCPIGYTGTNSTSHLEHRQRSLSNARPCCSTVSWQKFVYKLYRIV